MHDFFASGMHWKILNFLVFVGLLFYFLKKPILQFWKSRAETIEREIEEARKLRATASEQVVALEKRVGRLNQEFQEIIQSLREEGEMEKKRIVERANLFAERLKEDAERIAAQEIQRVKEQLRQEASIASLEMAERLMREKMTPADHQKLNEEFLKDLEGRL